jgi:hypothetical protein
MILGSIKTKKDNGVVLYEISMQKSNIKDKNFEEIDIHREDALTHLEQGVEYFK